MPKTKPPAASFWDGVDPEVAAFEKGLLESIGQMQRGEYAAVHSPETITARRAGRPVGTTKAEAKQAVTVRYSPDVLAAFRATGAGWQTRMNDALKDWLQTHSPA
jgi:uncharacterized protein (DUF4415 family)